MDFYRQALDLRAVTEDRTFVRRAYEGLGSTLAFTGKIPDALVVYQTMLEFAESQSDAGMQVSALNKLAAVLALRLGQFPEAGPYLARAERLAHEHDETGGIAETSVIRCQMCTAMADFDAVVSHMDEVAAIGRRLGVKEHIVMGLEHMASSLVFLTRFEEAEATAWEALAVAREIGDREHEAWLLAVTLALCAICRGDFAQAHDLAAEGVQVATRIGSLSPQVYGNWALAELARWQGDYESSILYGQRSWEAGLPLEEFMPFMTVQPLGSLGLAYLEISPRFIDKIGEFHLHALRLLETPGGMAGGGTAWADIGWCALALGDTEIAAECFEKGLHQPSMLMLVEKPRYLAGSALVASRQGRHDDALVLVEEACRYSEERDMRHMYPLMRLTAGRVHSARGEDKLALAQFTLTETLAAELQMRPLLWQAQQAAADALDALGRPAEATKKRLAAQDVIQEIAGLFHEETLRRAFLAKFESQPSALT
jgi:tetratricopeptide (TPR) repeat protein